MNAAPIDAAQVGVIICENDAHALELLGDAADLAARLGSRVDVCTTRDEAGRCQELFAHGADRITVLERGHLGLNHRLAGIAAWFSKAPLRVVFAGDCGNDRALAARLAARSGARLVSPALSVTARGGNVTTVGLSASGLRARQTELAADERAIVTLRPGVGQPWAPQTGRCGEILRLSVDPQPEAVRVIEHQLPNPATTDIVHLPRLVAGGRGVGGKAGFDLLRTVAERLGAGVAASRMAVDLGWIERERQVGQTGKTVHPALYVACGISGASHHCQGMAASEHIVAINVDPAAPIFRLAHLGLVADWQETLTHLLQMTSAHVR